MTRIPSEYYVKVKREKISTCNICETSGLLTWDHVPPQGSLDLSPVEQRNILQHMTATGNAYQKVAISQNGVKYRTLCKTCNSKLGSEYDPTLIEISASVGAYLKTEIALPPRIHQKTKPNRLARAILGHLLAAKAEPENTTADVAMRSYVLNPTQTLPKDIRILYWIYPHPNIIVIRDVVMPAQRGNFSNWGFFSILKYFPVAYLVTNLGAYEGLSDLSLFTGSSIDDDADIPIQLRDARHPEWPEMVDRGNIIAGGQSIASSVHAMKKSANKAL
jgi:hypothetical protein